MVDTTGYPNYCAFQNYLDLQVKNVCKIDYAI